MLRTVTVALDERTVATLVMNEVGSQTLMVRSVKSQLDTINLELDRAAVMELTLLLEMAQEAIHRGAVLTAQMQYKLETEDAVITARQSPTGLPF